MVVKSEAYEPERGGYALEWERQIELKGPRKEDPEKIAAWIKEEFWKREGSSGRSHKEAT